MISESLIPLVKAVDRDLIDELYKNTDYSLRPKPFQIVFKKMEMKAFK